MASTALSPVTFRFLISMGTRTLSKMNPNGEGLPHWPVFDQEERYLQLNVQPAVGQALKAHRLQLWIKTLPQKIQELIESQQEHAEL